MDEEETYFRNATTNAKIDVYPKEEMDDANLNCAS
jgi:hypothetical protein